MLLRSRLEQLHIRQCLKSTLLWSEPLQEKVTAFTIRILKTDSIEGFIERDVIKQAA